VSGNWQGIFLLVAKEGVRLELKDDLFLGDGSRLLGGISFSRVRRAFFGAAPVVSSVPWLELDWDYAAGRGIVRNHFADGTELVTLFSRYEDSQGNQPHGLFVGGALPDVSADARNQDESGMSYHDSRGWHHVWCNVNEGIRDDARGEMSFPGQWKFLGARVLIHDRDRVVIESSHELPFSTGPVRMDRFAYFRAGKPWFKLGIRLVNAGDAPARYSYTYGDEPWVGHFGSSAGNVGWVRDAIVRTEGPLAPGGHRWAGMLDEPTGIADFVSWIGEDLPDVVYFANQPGLNLARTGAPLHSNEVFIGLEWLGRRLAPGDSSSMLLSLGLAQPPPSPGALPVLPEGAGPP
jgi:hypothetical protein